MDKAAGGGGGGGGRGGVMGSGREGGAPLSCSEKPPRSHGHGECVERPSAEGWGLRVEAGGGVTTPPGADTGQVRLVV